MVLLRPFFGSVRTGNPQKVSLPPGSAHRTRGAGYGCPKDVWTRAGPRGASERFFRGVVSFEERSGIGASKCPPREDGREACPTLFGNKWLKSSVERLSGKSVNGSISRLLVARNTQNGAFSPYSAGSWYLLMEPIRSFQTVSGRVILRSSACEEDSLYAPITTYANKYIASV